jgi:ribosomal protein S18 acetylase RimI-like enzyme
MEALSKRLMAQGIEELWLEVKSGNEEAVGLYTKLGFIIVSVLPEYYSDGSDALRMRKSLVAGMLD